MSTILVAEDDDGVRELIVVALRRRSYDVIATKNGREAMDVLERDVVVDLLVSDLNMPGVGGLELLAFARARRPKLGAILASGTDRWELPTDRLEGDVTLLEKPFSINDLIAATERTLKLGRPPDGTVPATKSFR